MSGECNNRDNDRAARDINRVELYLMFSTDMDFRARLDGLESFIRSRLGNDSLIYHFSAREIPLGEHGDDHQFVCLSVELPVYAQSLPEGPVPNSTCFYNRNSWAEEAIDEVLLPAYMWTFAEIGIGNGHGLSSYFRTNVFDMVRPGGAMVPVSNWLKSGFRDGVRLLPRAETMSGNYDDSWAQFRFVLNGARNYGDPKNYIDSVLKEINDKYED